MRALPSLFSLVRVALAPVVALLIIGGRFEAAVFALAIAGGTDYVDGYLARRFQWTSRTGAWLDPLADKTLAVVVFVSLAIAEVVPRWFVVLVILRDAMILMFAALAVAFTPIRDFPPTMWGKVSTFFQLTAAGTLLVARTTWFGSLETLSFLMLGAATLFTVWSGLHYFYLGIRKLKRQGLAGAKGAIDAG